MISHPVLKTLLTDHLPLAPTRKLANGLVAFPARCPVRFEYPHFIIEINQKSTTEKK